MAEISGFPISYTLVKEKLQALVTSREEETAKNNDRGPVRRAL